VPLLRTCVNGVLGVMGSWLRVVVGLSRCLFCAAVSCSTSSHFSAVEAHDHINYPGRLGVVQGRQPSPLPCTSTYDNLPSHLFTAINGHSCLSFTVETETESTVCFMPDVVWGALGKEKALQDPSLCPCQGVKSCKPKQELNVRTHQDL
jgi:hypothetical protein